MMTLFRSSSLVLAALLAVTGCSGGCGNCTVPPINGATIPPSGPTPTPGPPVQLGCSQGAGSIPLGPALAPFAVLAGSTVTNVGNTLVTFAPGATTGAFNDDLVGVSPGTAVTGFYPPGTVTDGVNAIYAAGYNPNAAVPLAAQNALLVAYGLAAGKPVTTTFAGGTDLATASVPGHPTGTLPPGVYHSASTLGIMSGNLTLDGGGNAQSVFIFQVGSGLTTTLGGGASGNVLLTNGATPCNIYWQIGSSAVLGGATFNGNVMANQSITINATTFNGRALASVGAVSIPVAGGSLITNPGGT
jgi:hypothetical protein